MRGSCGKCGQTFDGQMLCPQCGIQLLEEGEGITVPLPVAAPDDALDGAPFVRRCALGGITLVGLYHGLKHLALAVLLIRAGTGALSDGTLLALAGVATLGAAAVAGTVNRRAEATGFLLGVAAAGGVIGVDLMLGGQPPAEWLFGVPMTLALLGVAGGFAGRRMMPPAPNVPRFARPDARNRKAARARTPRLAWLRVLLGVAVVVAGTLYADTVRTGLSRVLGGQSETFAGGRLVTWQLTVIAALAGGFVAGANTRWGLGQGFVTGLLAAAGVVAGLGMTDPAASLVVEFWMDQLGQKGLGPVTLAAIGATAWLGAAVGGWLGGQLLPAGARE